jgi:hypothetical protein
LAGLFESLHEPLDASVVGLFHILGEETSRYFSFCAVIGYAFTADTTFAAGCVGTGAVFQVLFLITVTHYILLVFFI